MKNRANILLMVVDKYYYKKVKEKMHIDRYQIKY
jgi:hypothetical protein